MNRTGKAINIIAIVVLLMTALFAVGLLVDYVETPKFAIAVWGFVVVMLFGCYRAYTNMKYDSRWSRETDLERQMVNAFSQNDAYRVFFNPRHMRFGTLLSLYILVLACLKGEAIFIILALVFIGAMAVWRWIKVNDELKIKNEKTVPPPIPPVNEQPKELDIPADETVNDVIGESSTDNNLE